MGTSSSRCSKDAQAEDAQEPGALNDYAFALGALAHDAADNLGHPVAVNRTVPMVYPKLRARFGPEVTYEDDPAAHLKTEFGFDVIEVARGQYANEAYHDFIGFQVAKPLLEGAFEEPTVSGSKTCSRISTSHWEPIDSR